MVIMVHNRVYVSVYMLQYEYYVTGIIITVCTMLCMVYLVTIRMLSD